MTMRLYALACTLIVSGLLAACSIIAPTTPAQTVYDIRAAYDATILTPAVAYASLPRCPAEVECSDPDAVAEIRRADAAVLATLDAAEATVRQHPDLDASAAIASAQNAVTAAAKILTLYGVTK